MHSTPLLIAFTIDMLLVLSKISFPVRHMVYSVYKVAFVIRNIEDIACYRIGRTRVTRLYVYVYNGYGVWEDCYYNKFIIFINSLINKLANRYIEYYARAHTGIKGNSHP